MYVRKQRPWSNVGAVIRDIFYTMLNLYDLEAIDKMYEERNFSSAKNEFEIRCNYIINSSELNCYHFCRKEVAEYIICSYEDASLNLSQAKELDASFIDSYIVQAELCFLMVIFKRMQVISVSDERDYLEQAIRSLELAKIIDETDGRIRDGRMDKWYKSLKGESV